MENIKIITYTNFPYGGASANFLRYFSLSLIKEGHEVEVILPKGSIYGKNVEVPNTRNGCVENIRYKHLCYINQPNSFIGKLLSNLCSLIFPFFYFVRKCAFKSNDIIILYNPFFSRLIGVFLIKALLRKKIILMLPEFYEKPAEKFSISLLNWYDFYFGFKYLIKYSDGYIVVSTYLKKYVQETLKVNKPLLLLPNLLDPENFQLNDIKPFKDKKITIGYTGTPTRKDGVVDLIKSFSLVHMKYPNTHLLIIGDVNSGDSVIPNLKELAMKLNVADSITFTGLVSFKEIPQLLNSCQILTLTRPSGVFAEAGFPTKLGEYFACRKPVLITKVGDIDTYLRDEVHAIIVKPDDVEDILGGFIRLIERPELFKILIDNAFGWMNENLNYKKVSKNISHFVNEL